MEKIIEVEEKSKQMISKIKVDTEQSHKLMMEQKESEYKQTISQLNKVNSKSGFRII